MKSYRKELWFDVKQRRAFLNVTPQVEECLRESGIKDGLLLCNAMH
ncbi:MAG: YjbQ family protein, partial [bacterium]